MRCERGGARGVAGSVPCGFSGNLPGQSRERNPDSVYIRDSIGDRDAHARCSRRRHACTRHRRCDGGDRRRRIADGGSGYVRSSRRIVHPQAWPMGRAAAGSTGGIREPERRCESGCYGCGRRHDASRGGGSDAISTDGSGGHRCQSRRRQSRRVSAVGQWRGDKRGRTACDGDGWRRAARDCGAAVGCADAEPGGAHPARRRRAPDGADVGINAGRRRNSVGLVFNPGFLKRRRRGARS
jgi:hypothetical protein